MNYLSDTGLFLIDTILGFFILIVMFRVLLQMTRADFYNPLSQFVVKVSNPVLTPLRCIVPGFFGVDLAAIVLLIVLESLRLMLINLLMGHSPNLLGLVILSCGELLKLATYVIIFSIFARAILSWFNPTGRHPMSRLLGSFTEPLLSPARRLIPATGVLDLAPVIVFIVLTVFLKLVVQPLLDIGRALL